MQSPSARRIRRSFTNDKYPVIVLRFEDGHEIRLAQGEAKSFDAYAGETIKVIALWDPSAAERDVVAVMKAEEFAAAD